ncbi:hypothetical protein L596_000492 [Steinernema carpocapsae]|uniref:Uncharacterized protein n=1 Tax=Steinernema carpocapsae TaxID=34508 RepID=A0A4U8UIK2_STECR|nr:hypothetical protein L596_000492 [Steinernema carpocapsae]
MIMKELVYVVCHGLNKRPHLVRSQSTIQLNRSRFALSDADQARLASLPRQGTSTQIHSCTRKEHRNFWNFLLFKDSSNSEKSSKVEDYFHQQNAKEKNKI